ncbi:MAG: hypothetical protein JW771_06850 [Candidatus Thermoplasmatota archaeon]|nr:hypothetical protein [Candidatus Thermoplasmatota archaeon]
MSLTRTFKACFLSSLLLFSLFSILFVAPAQVRAESTGSTTLYFHDYFTTELINETAPTKNNDSQWPPKITNTEEFIEWFLIWLSYKGILSEFNESELEEFGDFLDELEYLNPFFIAEYYDYYGEEDLDIVGDVVFDLYFSSTLFSRILKDEVNVGISLNGLGNDYNKTATIKSSLTGKKIQKTQITIPDVDMTLSPGDYLVFSIELMPSDKLIGDLIEMQDEEQILNITEQLADFLLNQTYIPKLAEIGQLMKDVLNESEAGLENFSLADVADLVNAVSSSAFVYDSVQHPSSVTLPGETMGENENVKTYYLREGKTMDDGEKPTNDKPIQADLKSTVSFEGPDLARSKIVKEATASLYIDHQDLLRLFNFLKGNIAVSASLVYDGEIIASDTKTFGKTTILDMFLKPDEPTIFTFTDVEYEIPYGEHLTLEIGTGNGTSFGRLNFRRNVKLLYDSTDFPSSLTVIYGETDHIQITPDSSDDVVQTVLAGQVHYTLDVTSEFKEDIAIGSYGFSSDESKKWDIKITPTTLSLDAGGNGTVEVKITSTDDDLNSYGDSLDVTFTASGKTGRALFPATIELSEDAVIYDITVIKPKNKDVKYGTNATYHIEIQNNNTGYWPDDYTIDISSKNDWNYDISEKTVSDLSSYVLTKESVMINVTVHVPKDFEVSSDKLTFKVKSKNSNEIATINITTTVIGPNILEALYDFFESSSDGMGLSDALGSSSLGAILLASIVFIIIFFVIIIIVYLLTIKYVELVCLERIGEITSDEEATYEITIRNPYKYPLTYTLSAQEASLSSGWEVLLDTTNVMLEARQSTIVRLTVKPTMFVKQDDWAEVIVTATVAEKQKAKDITTVTTIKDGEVEVAIRGMFHWPTVFKKGERITTSFKLFNTGNVSASNISVILYINGEEKNKVEDITIPREGYAEIEMPWIAKKGKNEINIVVK